MIAEEIALAAASTVGGLWLLLGGAKPGESRRGSAEKARYLGSEQAFGEGSLSGNALRSRARRFSHTLAVSTREGTYAGRERLSESGRLPTRPAAWVWAVAAAAITGVLAYALSGVVVLALLAGVVASSSFAAASTRRRRKKCEEMRKAWPDALRHIAALLESGDSLAQAVAELALSGPRPLRAAFGKCAQRYRAVGELDGALAALEAEIAPTGYSASVRALRLSARVGGTESISVVRTIAELASERIAAERDVEARQAWSKSAARAAAASPWVVLGLMMMKPQTAQAFRTLEGNLLIGAGALTTALGYGSMLALGRVRHR